MEPYYQLTYKTSQGKTKNVRIPGANTALNAGQVETAMNQIKASNPFVQADGMLLRNIKASRIAVTTSEYTI